MNRKMQKQALKQLSIIMTVVIICGYLFTSCLIKFAEPDYQRDMVVVEIEPDNVVVLQDINGFTWTYDTDKLKIGDTVIAYFDDNGTSQTIFDDEITKLQPLCISNY